MAITGWSTSDYLQAASAVWPGAEPFGVSIWAWKDNPGATGNAFALGQDGVAGERRILFHNIATNQIFLRAIGAATGSATVDDSLNAQWVHYSGSFVSSTLREIGVNAGPIGTDTTSVTPAAPNATFVGVSPQASIPWQSTGAIGSLTIWDLTGFTAQDRLDWAAELASGANPNTMDADVGQPWEGALFAYATLVDLTAPSLGSFAEIGSLSVFGSHPPVTGEGAPAPNAPTLVAEATSWDAVHLTATQNGETDSIEIYRSLSSPVDPQTDPIVATLVPDGQAFDPNRVPNETYFYLAVATNDTGATDGTEQAETTWTDDAIETFVNSDSIEIPFVIPSGERATEIRLKAGTAIRDLSVLAAMGSITVEVRDQDNNLVGSQTFNSLLNDSEEELDDLVVFLSPQPIGPQTITATFTSAISL